MKCTSPVKLNQQRKQSEPFKKTQTELSLCPKLQQATPKTYKNIWYDMISCLTHSSETRGGGSRVRSQILIIALKTWRGVKKNMQTWQVSETQQRNALVVEVRQTLQIGPFRFQAEGLMGNLGMWDGLTSRWRYDTEPCGTPVTQPWGTPLTQHIRLTAERLTDIINPVEKPTRNQEVMRRSRRWRW